MTTPQLIYTKAHADESELQGVDRTECSIVSRISTDRVDSDRDVVMAEGLDFSRLEKTRSVLHMHDPWCVIGKMLWYRKYPGHIQVKTKFASTPLAQELFELAAGGFIRGWSIGMDPGDMERRDMKPDDYERRPDWKSARKMITRAKVLEYSLVSIPANEDALTLAASKGLIRHTTKYWSAVKPRKFVRVLEYPLTATKAPLTSRRDTRCVRVVE